VFELSKIRWGLEQGRPKIESRTPKGWGAVLFKFSNGVRSKAMPSWHQFLNSSSNKAIFEIHPTCNNYATKNCIHILLLENEQMAQLGTPVIAFGVEKHKMSKCQYITQLSSSANYLTGGTLVKTCGVEKNTKCNYKTQLNSSALCFAQTFHGQSRSFV